MLHLPRTKIARLIFPTTFLLVLAGFFSPLHAQLMELYQTDHDAKPYYFGITLGFHNAGFHTEKHPRFLEYDSVMSAQPQTALGFQLGLSATARLTNRFEARFNPTLLFNQRSLNYTLKYPDPLDGTNVVKRIESVIFSFPLQAKLKSDRIGNFRVYMFGGGKMDLDLAANARAKRAEDLVKLQKFDFGVEAGLGFNFYFPSFILSPEIKISNGLRNIHSRDPDLKFSSVFDRIQSRMIFFTIHLEG